MENAFPDHRPIRTRVALCLLLALGLGAGPAQAIQTGSGDLAMLIEATAAAMPGEWSGGYTAPDAAALADWRALWDLLLAADYGEADALVSQAFPTYVLVLYTDTGHPGGDHEYYLLREDGLGLRGWGTYLVDPQYERQLIVGVPHAGSEAHVHGEGIAMLRSLGARFFFMNGTHRRANLADSPCSAPGQPYKISDMAHNTASCYHVAHEAALADRSSTYAISLHGYGSVYDDVCEDYFFSNGHSSLVAENLPPIVAALEALLPDSLSAGHSGDGETECNLNAHYNVQGRLLNRSHDPCLLPINAITGRFIHIEQRLRVREDPLHWEPLFAALALGLPPTAAPALPSAGIALAQNHPNPFNPATSLRFALARAGPVRLEIFTGDGRLVRTLLSGAVLDAGRHEVGWDGHDGKGRPLASGVYLYRLEAGDAVETRKMTLLK